MEKYCLNCMNIKTNSDACEHCGHSSVVDSYAHHLTPGTVLNRRYMVGHAIGEGGFGITYIGRDIKLDMIIAVKEYYPNGYTNRNNDASLDVTVTGNSNIDFFKKGKEKFIKEARVLAKFSGNKSIVDVRDFFEENNTAYIVMEYVDGLTLRDYLKNNNKFEVSDLFRRMVPLCEALKKVHKSGLIHRDISPDNIMILKDGSLKLMDFGAARDVNFEDKKSLSIILKPGYAPEEQYRSRGKQGPWTDIYAICATIYKCITGLTPDDSMERVFSDELKRPSELGIEISAQQEDALMKGMAIYQKDRFLNIDEFIAEIAEKKTDKVFSINVSSSQEDISEDDDRTESYDDDDEKTEYYDDNDIEDYDDEKTECYEDNDGESKEKHEDEEKKDLKDEKSGTQETEERSIDEGPLKRITGKFIDAWNAEEDETESEPRDKAENDPEEATKKSAKKYIMIGIVVSVIVAIAGIVLAVNHQNNGSEVNVIGMTQSEAENILKENAIKYEEEFEYDDDVGEGTVITQYYPDDDDDYGDAEYSYVAPQKLHIVISKGKQKVPNIIGEDVDKAKDLLWNDYSFDLSIESEEYSDSVAKGKIISQYPVSNRRAEKGSVISVVVSKGEKLYTVPDVASLTEKTAKQKLEESKMKVSVKRDYNSSVAKGKVIKQSVKSGKKVKENTKITITVSKGEKPTQASTNSSSSTNNGSYVGSSGGNSSGYSGGSSGGNYSSQSSAPQIPATNGFFDYY